MGKIEALQKRIEQIADRVRNLRYILFALMSAIIGLIFGISQQRVIENLMTDLLLVIGACSIAFVGILIQTEEKKRNKLISILETTTNED